MVPSPDLCESDARDFDSRRGRWVSWDFSMPVSAWSVVSEGRSARNHRSSGAVGELSCRDRGGGADAGRVKKSGAGRKPIDAIVMFRMLVLQALNNLSDEQVEYQVRDRLSFSRFLGLGIEDGIPDATTLWLFREKLAKAGLIEKLFERFDQHLAAKGYMARGGQMVDASIVPVPKQRNSRDENDEVKAGRTPAGWKKKSAKLRQKDRDARWTKKHCRSFFGYKNHVNADAKHKLIRRYAVTDAAVHDSQELDGLLNKDNTCKDVFADSAYRSAEIEAKLRAAVTRAGFIGAVGATIRCRWRKSERTRQEPDTRSHRACVRSAAELAGRPDRANDRHRAGARQDRLAEPGLQHSPPGDAGADRRGMKVKSLCSFNRSSGRRRSRENGRSN